jgi:hypothetical protein
MFLPLPLRLYLIFANLSKIYLLIYKVFLAKPTEMYAELFLKRVSKVLQDFLNFKHLVFAQEKCLSEDFF